MNKPVFPYKGNQVIISSGRVTHHSYDDFIMLFGKKGVAISTPASFNVDATDRVLIASPRIELGFRASLEGEPLLLGNRTAFQLGQLLDTLETLADGLSGLSESNLAASIPLVVAAASVLRDTAPVIKTQLQTNCLSDVTYTR
jgi:hypothetical protein